MNLSQYPSVSFSLTVSDIEAAMKFYKEAFGANEDFRLTLPNGMIAHVEFSIGDTHVMLSGEFPEWGANALKDGELAPCLFRIKTESSDDSYAKALAAGATSVDEPTDQLWQIRTSVVSDPFGYRWVFAQSLGEVSPEELQVEIDKM